jgi:hypothetical protein
MDARSLASALAGRLLLSSPGTRRNAQLFLAHLDDLRGSFRSNRVIHFVCDNAKFPNCHAVQAHEAKSGCASDSTIY